MVRHRRNDLLTRSDWTQLPDVPSGVRQAWGAYRQALRDISSQHGFPHLVSWPNQPD
ncbi:tail fiber assembly protein [Thauera aromatica]|uniref:tail fiber assembly protein n=1 Tax=Thauera aromatica TaxID=59405 RepID=UPI003CD0D25D